jgi:hypothetical protein
MIRPDFCDQPYIAEVLKIPTKASGVEEALETLVDGRWNVEHIDDDHGNKVTLLHGFIPSQQPYHRATRRINNTKGEPIELPRRKTIRRRDHFLYDIFMVHRRRHLVIAVPFHGLASKVFVEVDKILAGTGILYERLDITKMVVELGESGSLIINDNGVEAGIVLTRCHLAYSDPVERRRDIDQLRLSGSNLGASKIYSDLIDPVLRPSDSRMVVTPVLLGVALVRGGTRKSGAITDRHGNFKISVGPGLRQLTRLFHLLDQVERMEKVALTTSNVPIRLSATIEGVE